MARKAPKVAGQREANDRQMTSLDGRTMPDEVATFIVVSLAQFQKPSEIQKAIQAEFGIDVKTDRIAYYDPTRANALRHPPGEKWIALFKEARERYLEEFAGLRLVNKMERVKELSDLFDELKSDFNSSKDPKDRRAYAMELRDTLGKIKDEVATAAPVGPGGGLSGSGGAGTGDLASFIVGAIEGHNATRRLNAGRVGNTTVPPREGEEIVVEAKSSSGSGESKEEVG